MDIYIKIANNEPFCFVRLNDGEVSAIISESARISRGDEISSPELSTKLLNILTDTWINKNLYIGVPCKNCYSEYYIYVNKYLNKSKAYEFIQKNVLDANVLINCNYDKTLKVLMQYLVDRKVIVISNEVIIENINRLTEFLGIPVEKTYTVSSTMAFSNDYESLKDLVFQDNTFIITLCGPLGRVLCYEWYKNNTSLSCLDLGSFFDPLLRNKSYLYHTNNHKYCSNCYPIADFRFTKIFEYCKEYVNKECYYLHTYQDNINLYNRDFKRIILNTRIRLEKDMHNLELHSIMTQAKIDLFNATCNYRFSKNSNIIPLIDICKHRNPKKILEIGFGSSTVLFLENSGGCITSIDLINYETKYLQDEYKDRLTFINGNSLEIVPILTDIYDLIYIDGSKEYNVIIKDIINCYYKSTSETIVIVNDYAKSSRSEKNLDVIKAYDNCTSENLLKTFYEKRYDNDGIIAARYNWSDTNLVRQNNLLSKYMGKTNYIISLIDTIDIDSIEGENELKKITTHIEELILLKLKKNSHEGFAFQVPEQFEDLMNFCHSVSLNSQVKNILDIGFLHGSSALMFLLNTSANITSIDIINNDISEKYLLNKFPNRFQILHGNSNDIISDLLSQDKFFDIIYIDGSHDYDTLNKDIFICQIILNDNGFIIMNDVINDTDMSMCWNTNPTKIFNQITNKDIILEKVYAKGRGLAIFQIKKKECERRDILHLSKFDIYKEVVRLINININNKDILQRINVLTTAYIDYFSIIPDDDLYLIKYYNIVSLHDISMMENFVTDININNIIKNKALDYLKSKYIQKEVKIPKIVHLIYINQRELHSFNYKCINSVIKHMTDYQIWIHNDIEPDTEEWNLLKQNSNVYIKKIDRIKEYDGYKISHVQYEADIIRMNLLYEYGGIYLDLDIYMVKNIDSLLDNHSCYIAKETEDSIINCAIISEPGNDFIKIWLQKFATGFRINNWGWHIRDLPNLLLNQNPHYIYKYNIKILNYQNFCPVHWTEKNKLNSNDFKITDDMYGIHLFETIHGTTLETSNIINY